MKTKFLTAALIVSLGAIMSCDNNRVKERPPGIIPNPIDPAVLQQIVETFPEGTNMQSQIPALFAAGSTKEIVLTEESNVYLAYISEGASYENSFGWYSYNKDSPPASSADIEKHLLFPHVSQNALNQGDMLLLRDQKFPAGTVIGFFLIIHGWDYGKVNYDGETFYTNYGLNTDDQQQHVLFKEKSVGSLFLSFEDQLTSQESDKDFNDILFMVTDNKTGDPVTKINTNGVVELE